MALVANEDFLAGLTRVIADSSLSVLPNSNSTIPSHQKGRGETIGQRYRQYFGIEIGEDGRGAQNPISVFERYESPIDAPSKNIYCSAMVFTNRKGVADRLSRARRIPKSGKDLRACMSSAARAYQYQSPMDAPTVPGHCCVFGSVAL